MYGLMLSKTTNSLMLLQFVAEWVPFRFLSGRPGFDPREGLEVSINQNLTYQDVNWHQ